LAFSRVTSNSDFESERWALEANWLAGKKRFYMQDQEKNEAVSSTGEAQAAVEGSASPETPRNPNMKWYIIHS
jgi:hypothetical protein